MHGKLLGDHERTKLLPGQGFGDVSRYQENGSNGSSNSAQGRPFGFQQASRQRINFGEATDLASCPEEVNLQAPFPTFLVESRKVLIGLVMEACKGAKVWNWSYLW